jgi:hypothetical protein
LDANGFIIIQPSKAVNRNVARAIGDVFDAVADNWMFFVVLATFGYLIGPSLLVYLERTNRLPRGVIWTYSLGFVPLIVLLMATVAASPGYCNDPLPHAAFRPYYLLVVPILPLYVHYVRAETLQHPVHYGFILTFLSLGVFSLTVANEVFHLAYQSVQGHGVIYSGARAWECAYVNGASELQARSVVGRATLGFLAVHVAAMVLVRWRRRSLSKPPQRTASVEPQTEG